MNLLKVTTLITLLILSGCATTNITPEEVPPNQKSSMKFSEYKYVFIKPLTIATEFKDSNDNKKAVITIEEELFKHMLPVFQNLSEFKAYDPSKPGKTLIIEPHIEKMKAVSGAARLWGGVLAGSSAVILKVSYIDATSKNVIAAPSFYQHANAWGAAYSNGKHDRSMFTRITELASAYAADNF
ncbi:MAG: hypothetical protein NTV00_15735 [Methylococcales bacterium]|nr:hypothetical protein [Methylococcales bacterium]